MQKIVANFYPWRKQGWSDSVKEEINRSLPSKSIKRKLVSTVKILCRRFSRFQTSIKNLALPFTLSLVDLQKLQDIPYLKFQSRPAATPSHCVASRHSPSSQKVAPDLGPFPPPFLEKEMVIQNSSSHFLFPRRSHIALPPCDAKEYNKWLSPIFEKPPQCLFSASTKSISNSPPSWTGPSHRAQLKGAPPCEKRAVHFCTPLFSPSPDMGITARARTKCPT